MKILLIIIGTIATLIILVIGGAAYYGYSKLDDLAIHSANTTVEEFIKANSPEEPIKNELFRYVNAIKTIKSKGKISLVSPLVEFLKDNIINENELKFLKEVSDRVDKGEAFDFKKIVELLTKYEKDIPKVSSTVTDVGIDAKDHKDLDHQK